MNDELICNATFLIIHGEHVTVCQHPVETLTHVMINDAFVQEWKGPFICQLPVGHDGPCDHRMH